MKKSYCLIRAIVFLIVICPQKVVSQSPAVQKLIDTSLQIMQANAVNSATIDWTLLRNGKIYQSAIAPDIAMESVDKFNDIRTDEKIKVAIEWLQKQTMTK